MITPLTTYCQLTSRCIRVRPLEMTPMMNTPMIIPDVRPVPPYMEVPPSTQDAIASVSAPTDVDGCPDFSFAERTIPANAQSRPLKVHTRILIFSTLIPENLAAVSFPPTDRYNDRSWSYSAAATGQRTE